MYPEELTVKAQNTPEICTSNVLDFKTTLVKVNNHIYHIYLHSFIWFRLFIYLLYVLDIYKRHRCRRCASSLGRCSWLGYTCGRFNEKRIGNLIIMHYVNLFHFTIKQNLCFYFRYFGCHISLFLAFFFFFFIDFIFTFSRYIKKI